MDLSIIDTHLHIWNLDKVHYSWLQGDTSILARNYLPSEIYPSLGKVNVTKAVLVQAENHWEYTQFMLTAAENNEWVKGVVGWLPLLDPNETQRIIETEFKNNPYLKGVRHLIHNEPDENWLLQDKVMESLKILAHYQLTYDIVGVKEAHIKAAIKIADTIPSLSLVLDHLYNPPLSNTIGMEQWRIKMKEAAQHKSIFAKISGLGTQVGPVETWTGQHVQPAVEYALELFGVDRCFCGGDWPVSLLAGSYEKTIQIYRSIIENSLSLQDQEKVFNSNASLFYKL